VSHSHVSVFQHVHTVVARRFAEHQYSCAQWSFINERVCDIFTHCNSVYFRSYLQWRQWYKMTYNRTYVQNQHLNFVFIFQTEPGLALYRLNSPSQFFQTCASSWNKPTHHAVIHYTVLIHYAILLSVPAFRKQNTFLWSPYVIGQTIIFLPCDFYLFSSSFIPRLISVATDWMSTIFLHMEWP